MGITIDKACVIAKSLDSRIGVLCRNGDACFYMFDSKGNYRESNTIEGIKSILLKKKIKKSRDYVVTITPLHCGTAFCVVVYANSHNQARVKGYEHGREVWSKHETALKVNARLASPEDLEEIERI